MSKLKESHPDYLYSLLEVTRTATASEIKTQYKKLAIKYHPGKDACRMFARSCYERSPFSGPLYTSPSQYFDVPIDLSPAWFPTLTPIQIKTLKTHTKLKHRYARLNYSRFPSPHDYLVQFKLVSQAYGVRLLMMRIQCTNCACM